MYKRQEEDSLYFEHFFKVVYNKARKIGGLWIKLRKLKNVYLDISKLLSLASGISVGSVFSAKE